MWSQILDIFFPQKSLTGVHGSWVTSEELTQLASRPLREDRAFLQSQGIHHIDRLLAATEYDNPLMKKAIHTFKYKRIPELADALSSLCEEVIQDIESDSVLCPVPLHWTRKFQRGFNQSALLAKQLSTKTHCTVAQLLKRVRPTGHQAWRTKDERMHALTSAFQYASNTIPHTVLLIDDLATTGATLDACAHVLKKSGVQKVEALVIARA